MNKIELQEAVKEYIRENLSISINYDREKEDFYGYDLNKVKVSVSLGNEVISTDCIKFRR